VDATGKVKAGDNVVAVRVWNNAVHATTPLAKPVQG